MYTIEQIQKILLHDGRNITIDISSYKTMAQNATFIHPVFGPWIATPKKVVLQKTTHPKEANLLRSTSNIKTRENGKIAEKTQNTNIDKYGVKYSSQVPEIRQKIKKTCLKKYGSPSALGNKEIRQKGKNTKLLKYGDKNYRNEEQIKKTNLIKYGHKSAMSNKDISAKAISTKESKGLISRPKGKSWQELADELGVPRTSLQTFIKNNPSDDAIQQFIEKRVNGYSDIELEFSKLMGVTKFVGQVSGYRPDFKINDIYINIDGLYWHSQKVYRDKDYHFKLRTSFEKDDNRILQFRADDLRDRPHIIKSIINNAIGNTNIKVYARKCKILSIDAKTARYFLQHNHMMGSSNSRFIGLYCGEALVSVLGFKIKKKIMEIDRFASIVNYSVIGGLSKMINYLKNTYSKDAIKINYWVDLRYGVGKSLEKIGFSFQRDVQGWQWTDFHKTYHRSKCKASNLTQAENAKNKKLWQIYDAGQRLYSLNL